MSAESKPGLISIIIPAYNNEARMPCILGSIQAQQAEGSNIEAVVVDDKSQDQTAVVAQAYGARVLRNEKNIDRSASRNRGAREAQGAYFCFLDSDMELTQGVMTAAVKACQEQGMDGVMLPERSRGETLWAKSRNLEKIIIDSDPARNAIRFMRREVFETVGGFDESLVAGEDYDFHVRAEQAGFHFRLLQEGFIYHHEVASLGQLLRKHYHYGQHMAKYIRKHRAESFRQFNFFRLAYFKRLDLLLRHPLLALALVFFKTCQYAAGAAGMLKAKLQRPA